MRGIRRSHERGAAMVEFALLLPLFLLIIGGIVDGGRAFFRQIELTNAAREGARAAVVSDATIDDIRARAQAASPGITITTDATLCAGPGTNADVTSSIDFEWYFLGPALALVGGSDNMPTTLDSTAVMRCGG